MAITGQRFGLIVLAIAKMVVLIIAVGTVGFYVDKSRDQSFSKTGSGLKDMGFYGRQEFFLFATAAGFFVAVFSTIIAITGLHDKPPLAAAMFMAHLFCALSVLVSASLLARLTAKYSEKSVRLCKALENTSSDARCYQLFMGVVCGFVSLVLFIGESIVYFVVLAQKIGISFANMDNITS